MLAKSSAVSLKTAHVKLSRDANSQKLYNQMKSTEVYTSVDTYTYFTKCLVLKAPRNS